VWQSEKRHIERVRGSEKDIERVIDEERAIE